MKSSNNEITVHRNETFSIDRVVQNPDGSPYIVSKQLENPHLLLTVSSSKFQQNSKYELNYFLELFGPGAIPRFNLTNAIDLKSLKGSDGNPLFPSSSSLPDEPIFVPNVKRYKSATEYANSQGTFKDTDPDYEGYAHWILRSDTVKRGYAAMIESDGEFMHSLLFVRAHASVVPAIKINYEYISKFQGRDGKIRFGSYPQDRVTGIATLDGIVGTPGDNPTENGWISFNYKYYDGIEGSARDTTDIPSFYKDFTYGENKYRAIYFTRYRPSQVNIVPASNGSNSYQYGYGYRTGIVYYFEYKPITWSILKYVDNSVILLCDKALDNQAFASFSQLAEEEDEEAEGDTDYGFISYKDSNVRHWLNTTFLNTAFTEAEQDILLDSQFYDERSREYYYGNKVFLITPEETELIPEKVLNGPYLAMAYFDDVLCLIELDDAVFSITDADGNVEYKYAIHIPPEGELTESNVGTLKWVPYEFRFAHTFTKEVTCEWTPQTYLYSMQLVSGTTTLQYLRDACSSAGVTDRTGDKYVLYNRLKEAHFEFPEDFDIESHFRRFDVVIPILNPTKLSVLSNLEGVIQ